MPTNNITIHRDPGVFWFAHVDIKVLTDETLSPIDKTVFGILCVHADVRRGDCTLRVSTIAREASCSPRSVHNSLNRLEERGIIQHTQRFMDGKKISSHYQIIGHKAPCYIEANSNMHEVQNISAAGADRTRTLNNEIKDSLRGKPELPEFPEMPVVFENNNPTSSHDQQSSNPKAVMTLDDVPAIMKPTADYFLLKTGKQGFTPEEISALRELAASQMPTRVQGEITPAIRRFTRKGTPLSSLTMSYIASALRSQPTRNPRTGQAVKKRKSQPAPDPHPELGPTQFTQTDEEAFAEADRLLAEMGITRDTEVRHD